MKRLSSAWIAGLGVAVVAWTALFFGSFTETPEPEAPSLPSVYEAARSSGLSPTALVLAGREPHEVTDRIDTETLLQLYGWGGFFDRTLPQRGNTVEGLGTVNRLLLNQRWHRWRMKNDEAYAEMYMQTPGADSVGFPGAKGFGADATVGCVKDTVFVYEITTTDNTGAGSVDDFFENNQHGDTLALAQIETNGWTRPLFTGDLNCIIYAGQTRPGGGVGWAPAGQGVTQHRFLRINGGKDAIFANLKYTAGPRDDNSSVPTISMDDGERYYFYQNQAHWTIEKAQGMGPNGDQDTLRYLTYERNLYAEPNRMEPALVQQTVTDDTTTGIGFYDRVSWYDNHFQSSNRRNPVLSVSGNGFLDRGRSQIRRGTYYNMRETLIMPGGVTWVEIQDVKYLAGPMDDDFQSAGYVVAIQCTDNPDLNDNWNEKKDSIRIFVSRVEGRRNSNHLVDPDSLWVSGGGHQEIECVHRNASSGGIDPRDSLGAAIKVDTAITQPDFTVPLIGPDSVWTLLVTNGAVGDYRRIDENGDWVIDRDSALTAILADAQSGGTLGPSSHLAFDSAAILTKWKYPLASGTAQGDVDNDGVFDGCEKEATGSDTDSTSATPQGDPDVDGFINIIECWFGEDAGTYTNADGSEGAGGPTPAVCFEGVSPKRFCMLDTLAVDTFCPPTGSCGGSTLTIAANHLVTEAEGTSVAADTTANVSVKQDSLVLVWVAGEGGNTVDSVKIGSLKLTQEISVTRSGDHSALFRGMPSAAITNQGIEVYWSAASTDRGVSASQFAGIDTSGTNGSGAIVQSVADTSTAQETSASVTLAAFGSSNNRPVAGFQVSQRDNDLVEGTDFTMLGEATSGSASSIGSEWRSDAEDTNPDISWTQLSHWGASAVEVAAGSTAPAADTIIRCEESTKVSRIADQIIFWRESRDCENQTAVTNEGIVLIVSTDTPSAGVEIDSVDVDSLSKDGNWFFTIGEARDSVMN